MESFLYMDQMGFSSPEVLLGRVRRVKHIALDMDGTIYNGAELFPFTVPFLDKMKMLGVTYSFLTNNPSKGIDDYLLHLTDMGIASSPDEIYTSALATIDYLKNTHPEYKRLFILGTPSMIGEFEKAGYISTDDSPDDLPDALVVGFDMTLNYSRLCRAAWWASEQVPYVATNPDFVCPTNQRTVLVDCGSIFACIKEATGRAPDVVIGKPDPRMLSGILSRYSLDPSEVMMVGDRIYTDVKMAENAGAIGVLVLSGETTIEVVKATEKKPDIVVQSLEELGRIVELARNQE